MELTQGSKTSPAHDGQATLSPWKVSKPRIIHFDRQSDFWKPRWHKSKLQTFQERLGGRIALVAEISIQGVSIICHNLHLGRRLNDELRLVQLNEVLQDAGVYDSTKLVVVVGDLNLNASKPVMADALARAGFRDVVPTSRVPTTPARNLLEAGRHIDWAFVRGPSKRTQAKFTDPLEVLKITQSHLSCVLLTPLCDVVRNKVRDQAEPVRTRYLNVTLSRCECRDPRAA